MNQIQILHLPIKKKWFDMIASGEKTEEYREIKPHWISRLMLKTGTANLPMISFVARSHSQRKLKQSHSVLEFKKYDQVCLRNGYNKNSPTLYKYVKDISIGQGRPEWGAEPGILYFIIHLGITI